nr:hypothetical protein [Tanacetum cinerariifolium]
MVDAYKHPKDDEVIPEGSTFMFAKQLKKCLKSDKLTKNGSGSEARKRKKRRARSPSQASSRSGRVFTRLGAKSHEQRRRDARELIQRYVTFLSERHKENERENRHREREASSGRKNDKPLESERVKTLPERDEACEGDLARRFFLFLASDPIRENTLLDQDGDGDLGVSFLLSSLVSLSLFLLGSPWIVTLQCIFGFLLGALTVAQLDPHIF